MRPTRVAGLLLSLWAGACPPLAAQPPSVREQIRNATPAARNQALGSFLERHGKDCPVAASEFSGTLQTPRLAGDAWSVRCANGSAFAVLIGNDAASTAWFLPCEAVERLGTRRCFENARQKEVLP